MPRADRCPAVSVIVPIYNGEDYLSTCLDSLLSQTLADIEIVVVNDGSTDGSQALIEQYAAAHPGKIVSLVKPNGGLSDARNFGVRHARGEFIGFVDGDDYVDPGMFEDLYRSAQDLKCDVSICQYVHYALDGRKSIQPVMRESGRVFRGIDYLLDNRSMVVWNKLYRSELIRNIPFPVTWFEDVAWTPVVLSRTERICYVNRPHYHYVRRPGSIASSHEDLRTLQGISSIWYALDNCDESHRDAVAYFALNRLLFESKVRTCYADKYIAAIKGIQGLLESNTYYLEDDQLRATTRQYLGDFPVIPKRIYYGHFGRRPLTRTQQLCLDSWTRDLIYGDGEIVRLDESNCDVQADTRIAELYRQHRYDLVAHYFTLQNLIENGGVALTLSTFGRGFLAPHLVNGAFFALADGGRIYDGILGGVAGHRALRSIFDLYRERIEPDDPIDGSPLSEAIETYLTKDAGADLNGNTQKLTDGITLFGPKVFYTRRDPATNVSEHCFDPDAPGSADEPWIAYRLSDIDKLVEENRSLADRVRRLTSQYSAASSQVGVMRKSLRWSIASRFAERVPFAPWIGRLHRVLSPLAQVRQRLRTDEEFRLRTEYAKFLERLPIRNDLVLLESFYGRGLISNPLALFTAWTKRPDFRSYTFVWVLDDLASHAETIERTRRAYTNVSFVQRGSRDYLRTLAQAKYLINDVTFLFYFVKRHGQVYINPWHSITVKSLGYDIPGKPLDQKNVVRNFLGCDYFLAANDFVRDEVFIRAHMMHEIYPGQVLTMGHPRNDLSFQTTRQEALDEMARHGIDVDPGKRLIVFAPTWRGTNIQKITDDLDGYRKAISVLEDRVGSDYSIVIRLHQATYANLPKDHPIRAISVPPTIDANRMFAATDVLITDYSSIFFDFMITGRPIFFYVPDLEEYRASRGVYFEMEELPGLVSDSIEEIADGISNLDAVAADFAQRYKEMASWACAYDDGRVSDRVLDATIGASSRANGTQVKAGRKRRVLAYAGGLADDKLFAKLNSVIEEFDDETFDFTVVVPDDGKAKTNRNVRLLLDRGVRVIGFSRHTSFTPLERYLIELLGVGLIVPGTRRLLRRAFAREWRRCLGDATFDIAIDLEIRSPYFAMLLACGEASSRWAPRVEDVSKRPRRERLVASIWGSYDILFSSNRELREAVSHYKHEHDMVGRVCEEQTPVVERGCASSASHHR